MKNLKAPLKIIGIGYLVFGTVMTVWMFLGQWYPTVLYFYSIGIGIFFLLINGITKRLPGFRIWQSIIGVLPLLAFYIYIQLNKPSDDIFIIPENYKGVVRVIYDQKDGAVEEFEEDKRVYRIPNNGILKTRFKVKGNSIKEGVYYYENDEKERVIIKTYYGAKPVLDSTAIYVHHGVSGTRTNKDGKTIYYKEVIIGTEGDVK